MEPIHWLIVSPILVMMLYNGTLLVRELYRSTKRDKTFTLRARVAMPQQDADDRDVTDNNDDWVTVEINGVRVKVLRDEQLRRVLNR